MKPRPGAHDSAEFTMLTAERHADATARQAGQPNAPRDAAQAGENPQTPCGDPIDTHSSPDPMRATDRYRLVMPYSLRL